MQPPKSDPPAESTPADAASPSPAEEIDLAFEMDRLTQENGKLVYNADQERMTDHFRLYELDPAELTAALGTSTEAKAVVLRVAITARRSRSSAGDPRGAVPMGGFTYETMTCKIVKLISAQPSTGATT